MRFSIEQTFLTDSSGKPLKESPSTAYHSVEAETLDDALASFLTAQQASLIGNVQRLPGAHAVATAHQQGTVFTFHVVHGTDTFQRERRGAAGSSSEDESERDRTR